MKRVITYLELLQMVKDGNPPKFIKAIGEPFVWDDEGATYVDRYDNLLSDYLGYCGTKALILEDWIKVIEQ